MKAQEQAESHQRKIFIMLLYLIIFIILVGFLIRLTDASYQRWDNAKIEVVERDFYVALASVITQAKLQGRVQVITLNGRQVEVNEQGRPSAQTDQQQPDCDRIWLQVMGGELGGTAYGMSSQLISSEGKQPPRWSCRYGNGSDHYFDYTPDRN